jgi:hypothetical protein
MKRVKKFVKCLIDFIYFNNIKNCKLINIKAINDKTYFLKKKSKLNFSSIQKKIKVIEPSDNVALYWNLLLTITITSLVLIIPFNISFNNDIF